MKFSFSSSMKRILPKLEVPCSCHLNGSEFSRRNLSRPTYQEYLFSMTFIYKDKKWYKNNVFRQKMTDFITIISNKLICYNNLLSYRPKTAKTENESLLTDVLTVTRNQSSSVGHLKSTLYEKESQQNFDSNFAFSPIIFQSRCTVELNRSQSSTVWVVKL